MRCFKMTKPEGVASTNGLLAPTPINTEVAVTNTSTSNTSGKAENQRLTKALIKERLEISQWQALLAANPRRKLGTFTFPRTGQQAKACTPEYIPVMFDDDESPVLMSPIDFYKEVAEPGGSHA